MIEAAPVYRDVDFEHGLRCHGCNGLFSDGDEIADQFDGLTGDGELVIVNYVCQPCSVNHPVGACVPGEGPRMNEETRDPYPDVLRELTEAGDDLVEAAVQHWDAEPLRGAVRRWRLACEAVR